MEETLEKEKYYQEKGSDKKNNENRDLQEPCW